MAASGAIVGARRSRASIVTGTRTKTPSNEELSDRRSSIRKSLDSGLDYDDDEGVEGPVKARFMPFFRKFWPNLEKEGSFRQSSIGGADEQVIDDPTDSLRSINPSWYGKPVEEVDPFIFEDTFCVISKKYSKHYIYRFSCTKSMYLIGPLNPFRKLAICIVTHQWFDILIILTILANCVTLGMTQNKFIVDEKSKTGGYKKETQFYEETTNQIEYAFLGVYTLEMVLKIIAKGFVMNKFSYLRNKWNILDFVVVSSGYIILGLGLNEPDDPENPSNDRNKEFDVLRTFRVLRAVKTISILPGLRMMINALLSSVVQLLEVMALTLFCLMIFALFALEVYMGKLRHKCVKIKVPPLPEYENEAERNYAWGQWVENTENWYTRDGPKGNEFVPCSNETGTRLCPKDYVCLGMRGENPDDGWTSFDNFFASMLTTFQLITLDYWERIYDLVLSTSGPWSIVFFTMVVFLGSYYLLNLMLAVVAMSYEAEAHNSDQGPLTKHQKLSLVRTHSTFSFEDLSKLNIKEMTYYRKRTPSEREMIAKKLRNSSLGKRKPRRAIRRKQQNANKGAELTVSEMGTGTVGSPNVKSAAGSICGDSICAGVSVIDDGESAMSPDTRGSIDNPTCSTQKQPSPAPRPTINKEPKRKKRSKDGGGEGGKNVRMSDKTGSTKVKKPKVNKTSSVIGSGSVNTKPIMGGGKRVSGYVKAVSDKDRNRFILETDEQEHGGGTLGDTIFNLLGLRMTLGEEMRRLGSLQSSASSSSSDSSGERSPTPPFSPTKSGEVAGTASVAIDIENRKPGTAHSAAPPPTPEGDFIDKRFSGDSIGSSVSSESIDMESLEQVQSQAKTGLFLRNCRRCSLILKTRLRPVVNHCVFEAFITICIICNTILLALEQHGMTNDMKKFLDTGNQFFMAIFTAECIVKLMALQREYFQAGWNIFDIIIVGVSYIDFIIETILNLSVIRGMRLLRVFKLAQSWITMKVLLNIIFSTFGALGNLTLVLLIVIYIFAVMGMQVIGGQYTPKAFGSQHDPSLFPRWHFQNFWYSFMMVFRVLCGEWIEPLWDCLKAHQEEKSEYKCFFIFLPILIVGNFIVLNLFLALLLNSFNTEELKAQRDKEMEATGKTDNLKTIVGMLLKKEKQAAAGFDEITVPQSPDSKQKIPKVAVTAAPETPKSVTPSKKASREANPNKAGDEDVITHQPVVQESAARVRFKHIAKKVILRNRKDLAVKAIERASEYYSTRRGNHGNAFLKSPSDRSRRGSTFGLNSEPEPSVTDMNTMVQAGDCIPKRCWNSRCCICERMKLWDWTTWNKVRGFAVSIVAHPAFEWMILALIFASSITLAFEDKHLDQNEELKQVLFVLNNIFTVIFFIEMILKWFAMGLWGYFTNAWTILDAFIVIVSLVTLYFDIIVKVGSDGGSGVTKNFAALKALRTLRALRPLRAISRWQGMKIVVNALMYAIPSIFNVLLVCLLFWLVFSIMGVQFFKGKFYKCVDTDGDVLDATVVPNRDVCCSKADTDGYSWINSNPNFDNVLEGYLSLFQIATFEGWMELMQYAVDSTEENKQPIRDNGVYYYVFFVIFIVFGSFFTLNLFIGVIIDNFNMLKKKYEGNLLEVLLTPSQRHYYTAMKKLGRKKPRKVIKRPNNNFVSPFYDIAMSRKFEIAIFIMIFINMVVMAFEHYGQRQIFVHLLAGFNSFFTTIYALEAIVKIIGLRHYYFTVPWNVFDFVLVLASIVDLLVGDLTVEFPIPPTMLRIVRVFRIGRVLRLVKAAKGIRKLLFALVVSLPALFNIGALLALITFIYAILGMALFRDVPQNNAIDAVFNFETFLNSSLMLFRLMTAAGWNDVLSALTVVEPVCGPYRKIPCGLTDELECPNKVAAVAYIVSYIIISYLIVINMYIAIILENFVEANREEEVGIVEDDLEMFYVRWSRYDPQATQFINFDQLSDFLASLDPPLTLPKPNIVAIVAFNLPIARGNKIHCLDILHALVKHVLGQIDDTEEFRKLQEQMERKFQKQFPTRKLLDVVSSTRVWKIQQNAAIIIQRAWRRYRLRKHPPPEKQKSTQTIKTGVAGVTHQGGVGNMLNRMGNLLHIGGGSGSHDQKDKSKRRESIAMRDQTHRGSMRGRPGQPKERNSESSISSSSPLARVDTNSGLIARGSTGDGSSTGGGGGGNSGNRGRRLSPSRLSGGSFDVAVNFGNQLSVIRNANNTATNGPSPLPSCPTTPSSLAEESANVIVQIHQFQ